MIAALDLKQFEQPPSRGLLRGRNQQVRESSPPTNWHFLLSQHDRKLIIAWSDSCTLATYNMKQERWVWR